MSGEALSKYLNELSEDEAAAAAQAVQAHTSDDELLRVAREGAAVAQGRKLDQLRAEYERDMLANRGNAAQIRRVMEHYRRLGLPIDKIGFNV